MDSYERWVLRVPKESEPAMTAELWSAATLGVEMLDRRAGNERLLAWFERRDEAARAAIATRLERLGGVVEAVEIVDQRDWMTSYREAARPFPVGASLWVDPGEPDASPNVRREDRRCLHLPARSAFGTGSHESTRLAVELIERQEVAGLRCLDLGTGSGILSFLLVLGGARWVLGIDNDPVAALQAGDNRRLNRLWPALAVATGAALAPTARFDLCVANLLASELVEQLETIAALVPEGVALFAGLLARDDLAVSERLAGAGFEIAERRTLGEWIGYRTSRGRS